MELHVGISRGILRRVAVRCARGKFPIIKSARFGKDFIAYSASKFLAFFTRDRIKREKYKSSYSRQFYFLPSGRSARKSWAISRRAAKLAVRIPRREQEGEGESTSEDGEEGWHEGRDRYAALPPGRAKIYDAGASARTSQFRDAARESRELFATAVAVSPFVARRADGEGRAIRERGVRLLAEKRGEKEGTR